MVHTMTVMNDVIVNDIFLLHIYLEDFNNGINSCDQTRRVR